ncbi:hypothetical protein ACSBR2_008824 [Camellia fascicularis]
MARAMVLLWVCCMLFLATANADSSNFAKGIGVNWGSQVSQNLLPSVVVQLLKDNGIGKVKLFDSDDWTVKAFAGSGIEVMLGIPNNELKRLSDSYDDAQDWVKENVTKHTRDGGVDIKYVAVGNEPFLTSYNGTNTHTLLPAMKNIQKALDEAGHGDKIKVTTPQNADVYDSGTGGPSEGNFRKDIRNIMIDLVRWLDSINSAFLVNIYPFLSLYQNSGFPIDFAFFDGGAKPVKDKDHSYDNMFDANLDTLVWSLKKAGVPDLKIIVGEAGWPTDGNINANNKLARRFYNGFLKKLATDKGTPLRPGHMEVYLFSLLDENMKSIAPGAFERHWGIFRYDGKPKFPVDFSGKGDDDKFPVAAKGVKYVSSFYCVFNKDVKNMSLVPPNMSYACSLSDCTALGDGSSCSKLDNITTISYAFNMYFQMNGQDVEACVFNGLATITSTNLSTDSCLFPLALESAGTRLNILSSITATTTSVAAILFTLFALF